VIESFTGKPVDREYVEQRERWERLYETTQTKGDGEAHPFLSPNDEFANFEIWDKGQLGPAPKTPDMLPKEYAREALKRGMAYEAKLGVNPFKFGMIGSSDAHTGLAAMEEDNFFGKTAPQEPSPERMTKAFFDNPKSGVKIMDWEVGASGYAAVWATENTRDAIFDAMKRRETFATTGPRMAVRFFGGWDFDAKDAHSRSPAEIGYAKGVPMGGDLKPGSGKAPTFLVAALKDPFGGNLDRVQIVKGWRDATGETQEKSGVAKFADGLMRHVVLGAELTIAKVLAIRIGYNYQRRQELKLTSKAGLTGFTMGAGLRVKMFNLSYTRASYTAGIANNYITVGVNLQEFVKKQ